VSGRGRIVTSWLRQPVDDTLAAMEQIVAGPRPLASFGLVLLAMTACWYVYVPVHELLHALGCTATGGTVTTLEIQVQYGGSWLARVFPFVVPGGDYAGRLTGFDTHGSDVTYLATDVLPFALSVLLGVPALRACTRRRRPLLMGVGVVVGLAPFYNVPGDYYEMGSILTTRAAAALGLDFTGLRGDDLARIVVQLFEEPRTLGVSGPGLATLSVLALSTALAFALAFATWASGDLLARRFVGPSRPLRELRTTETD